MMKFTKYLVLIDYKAGRGNDGFEYKPIEAKSTVDAMELAERFLTDEVYLIKLMEKKSTVRRYEGFKVADYESTLCKRSAAGGWRRTDGMSENVTNVKRYINKHFDNYEIF